MYITSHCIYILTHCIYVFVIEFNVLTIQILVNLLSMKCIITNYWWWKIQIMRNWSIVNEWIFYVILWKLSLIYKFLRNFVHNCRFTWTFRSEQTCAHVWAYWYFCSFQHLNFVFSYVHFIYMRKKIQHHLKLTLRLNSYLVM